MEEKEIDFVIADDLQPGDLIMVDGKVDAIHKALGNEFDSGLVDVYTENSDEPVSYRWDQYVTLYGY